MSDLDAGIMISSRDAASAVMCRPHLKRLMPIRSRKCAVKGGWACLAPGVKSGCRSGPWLTFAELKCLSVAPHYLHVA